MNLGQIVRIKTTCRTQTVYSKHFKPNLFFYLNISAACHPPTCRRRCRKQTCAALTHCALLLNFRSCAYVLSSYWLISRLLPGTSFTAAVPFGCWGERTTANKQSVCNRQQTNSRPEMAQCSEAAHVSSALNGEQKRERKVAVITGITGQVTFLTQTGTSICT